MGLLAAGGNCNATVLWYGRFVGVLGVTQRCCGTGGWGGGKGKKQIPGGNDRKNGKGKGKGKGKGNKSPCGGDRLRLGGTAKPKGNPGYLWLR